jgi:hypothetical protein
VRDLLVDPNPLARRARLLQGNSPCLRRSSTPCAICWWTTTPSRAGRGSYRGAALAFVGAAPRARLTHFFVGAAPRARSAGGPKPHRAQGAAPTGEHPPPSWEQHPVRDLPLPLWEQHPVRALLVDPNPLARRARLLQIHSAKGHQEKVSTM